MNLYSPATASESSGFSEVVNRERGFSPPNTSTFLPLHMRPGGGGTHFGGEEPHGPHGLGGRASPQLGIPSYHNPGLTASPYSTLPRRPGGGPLGFGVPPPIMASTVGRNSPLLELTGYTRSSSLGRNSSLTIKEEPDNVANTNSATNSKKISNTSVRAPLLNDDRESCV